MQLISFDFFVFFLLAMAVLLGMSGKLKRWCLLGINCCSINILISLW